MSLTAGLLSVVVLSLYVQTVTSSTTAVDCSGCSHPVLGCSPNSFCTTNCCTTIATTTAATTTVTTTTATTTAPNDAPVITSLPASVDLSEDATASTLLHSLTTYDANGDSVTCSINTITPANGPFFLKVTGPTPVAYSLWVTSLPNLNYSDVNSYEISVTCQDTSGASDTDTFYVYIVINGMPVINNLYNSTTISSTLATGSQVFEVLTFDSEGDSLTFTLSCTNTALCPFSIYSSGVILLTSNLLGTTDLAYEVDVTASDGNHATAAHRLTVFVSGLNTPPTLTNLPATINVAEDTASATSIFTINIYDNDGDTSFTISATYTPTSGATLFSINSSTQEVSIATGQTLDYETTPVYVLNVTVSDGSDSSWDLLTVQVADVNEKPVLLKEQYSVVQDEGTGGTSFNAPTMEVTDPDNGDILTYSLDSSSNSTCSYIAVNASTGVMKYDADFDVDDTSLGHFFYCYIKVEDSGGLSVTATVTVSIEDVNDNDPAFVSNSYVFTVSQTAGVGTTIGQVSATDDDYSTLYSDLTFTLNQSLLSQPYFAIDNSGVVTLAASVINVAGGTTLTTTVNVKNTGFTTSDTATLYITITASSNSKGFWDEGANIAWVTLTILGGLALLAMAAYLLWRYCRPFSNPNHRFLRVKPSNKGEQPFRKNAPRPARAGKPPSPPLYTGMVTPTDVNIKANNNNLWDAWNNKDAWH